MGGLGFWTAAAIIVGLVMSPALLAIAGGLVSGHRKEMAKLRLGGAAPIDRQELERLAALAERLEQRTIYLESVLDSEAPGWRSRSDRR